MRDDTADSDPAAANDGAEPAPRGGPGWTRQDVLLLGIVTLVGAALRLLDIEQWSFGALEAGTWRALTSDVPAFAESAESRFPVVYLIVGAMLDTGLLPGVTEGWLRLPFAFVGAMMPPLVALLALPTIGRTAAVLAAVIAAVHPALVEASQTAHPRIVAIAAACAVGLIAQRGLFRTAAAVVVVAGLCHPVGWLAGVGMLLLGVDHRRGLQLSGWLVAALLLCAAPLWSGALMEVGVVVTAVAGLGIALAPRCRPGFALAALAPLSVGGLWWWTSPADARAVTLAVVPVAALLAASTLVRAFAALRPLFDDARVARVVAATPGALVLGKLATATFLYFAIHDGGRPPWRDARDGAVATRLVGTDLRVLAGRGADVLRVYLRPNHWWLRYGDPHPGVHVLEVEDFRGASDALVDLLAQPGAVLILQRDEWLELRAGAAETPALLAALDAFDTTAAWPHPTPSGDDPVYLLRRRADR